MKREVTSIDFGEWIRKNRKAKKMSQREFGARIKSHETSVGRWERGEASPTLEQAEEIAKIFGAELVIREKGIDERAET